MVSVTAVEKKKLANPPLDMRYFGDRVLRQPAKRIAKVDDKIRSLIREMLQTMYSADGIGLAAPQVGISKQLVVIDIAWNEPEKPPLVLINPKITQFGATPTTAEEGCLSIPGVYMEVTRPDEVEISYRNELGKPCKLKTTGLLSRAIQHEIDHLNGVMFVDRVDNSLALNEQLTKKGFSVNAVKPIKK
ncbi:MAG: peptide deformylase [Cyanobacteria bacterium J06621_8]